MISHTATHSGLYVFTTMCEIGGKNAEAAKALRDWMKSDPAIFDVIELDVRDNTSVVELRFMSDRK